MEIQYQEAIKTLIEGFHNQRIDENQISEFLLDKTRYGLTGYATVANRSLLRNEPQVRQYRLEGWEFFKRFANMLGLVYGDYCSKYEHEQNWVNRKNMHGFLDVSERTFDRFQRQVDFVQDFHVRRLNGRMQYHKRNVSELYSSYRGED